MRTNMYLSTAVLAIGLAMAVSVQSAVAEGRSTVSDERLVVAQQGSGPGMMEGPGMMGGSGAMQRPGAADAPRMSRLLEMMQELEPAERDRMREMLQHMDRGEGGPSGLGPMGPGGMMGPGMMGQGGMMGPGMMGQGGVMCPGMMGQGMMGPRGGAMGPMGIYGFGATLDEPLTVDRVEGMVGGMLDAHGNPRLVPGDIEETETGEIIVDIETIDGSLVQRLAIDRHTGQMRHVHD